MSTDVKEITDTVEEVAFGAAESAAEMAADPIGTVRKQVKNLERKGTPAARKVNRRLNTQIESATAPAKDAIKMITKTATKTADWVTEELMPEKVAIKGLRLLKVQAKRPDVLGDASKRTLKFFNHSFKTVARVANRLENASELAAQRSTAPATRRASRRSQPKARRTRGRRAA
ncbi:MAG TPA: hypothetical protein VKT20_08650 [Candidatus Dormibacteraeota bacterium]|nr:hypothetical protein [Candidatus Dormibacteraeota bacterium]